MSALSVSKEFSDLADPGMKRTRLHSLHDILVIALCVVVCGAEGWDDFVEFVHATASRPAAFPFSPIV